MLIDDTIYTPGWERHYTVGPTKAWIDHLITGKISGINRVDYAPGRGMSWVYRTHLKVTDDHV